MPTGGVTTRNKATPKTNASKQQTTTAESPAKSPTTSTMESIQTQLSQINGKLKQTVKVDDIKSIIKSVVTELFQNHQENIDKKWKEEVSKLRREIQNSEVNNV
jgi:hypothetical protein